MGYVQAGAAVLGDVLGMQGANATNAASRAFAAQQQQQAEQYNTQMSDTAMQRRKADLEAAGFNPLLAVSQGGASTPTATPVNANMTNPMSGFSNLGQQASSAIQTAAQVDQTNAQTELAKAQAAKTKAETPSSAYQTGTPGSDDYEVGDDYHKLGNATLAQIQANTNLSASQQDQVKANTTAISANIRNTDADTALKNTQQLIQGQNYEIIKATRQAVIQQATAEGAAAGNLQDVEQGKYGRVLTYLNALLKPASSAAGIADKLRP